MKSYRKLPTHVTHGSGPYEEEEEEEEDEGNEPGSLAAKKSLSLRWWWLGVVVMVGAILLGGTFWAISVRRLPMEPPGKCNSVPESQRFDCYPERDSVVTPELCQMRGCCFLQNGSQRGSPWCFYPPSFPSYTLKTLNRTKLGFRGMLTRTVKTCYPQDVLELQLQVDLETDTRLHIKLTDPNHSRYEVPLEVPPATKKADNPLYSLDFSRDPFGILESYNLYGVHPFYLSMEEAGSAHGVFLLNSNAMEVVLQPAPALTWRTVGGILDFYIFLGPDPSSVVQQYQQVIGFPSMPPLWGLGFHLCRWGYGSSNQTWQTVKNMRNYLIPQDAQWNDIDYMEGSRIFTIEPKNFDTLPQLVMDLHNHGQYYVLIMDPAISSTQATGTYAPYEEGLKKGIFINNTNGQPLIGEVWPGLTAFPDFSNPETHQWWLENLNVFHARVPFDGLWIDMNEPSNFKDGSVDGCTSGELDNPPYKPAVLGGSLFAKTICTSAKQSLSSHYNLHNLYGLMEAKATASALIAIRGKRPFVISRSTFPSQGRYSGHWLGDNRSEWKDMYWSIPGLLNFNLFGIPLVGADICGFSGSTTEELCIRWMQLGAFYPFARNHNTINEKAQDPTVFSPPARTAMKEALMTRYALLPYLYTLFHHAHVCGETVARPLFFEFPQDKNTYALDQQFLWGRNLLVTPVLESGVDAVTGYFPQGIWYDYYTGSPLQSQGEKLKLAAPLNHVNVHIREGAVLPTQKPNITSWMSSGNPLLLVAALSQEGMAWGDFFWDDGESLDTFERGNYSYVMFNISQNVFTSTVLHCNLEAIYITVDGLTVYGVQKQPQVVTVNDQEIPFSYLEHQVLSMSGLHLNLSQSFSIKWI
ncbi:lysosomal alpha-glucosidase-like isoform X2 [Macrotis lagotis]|uniref:lysosomal alpha-glucosidase-like isoform X2 n=1 Tax=Macrotis lagotis TaxID=92651 RepID=UPI003D6855AD